MHIIVLLCYLYCTFNLSFLLLALTGPNMYSLIIAVYALREHYCYFVVMPFCHRFLLEVSLKMFAIIGHC